MDLLYRRARALGLALTSEQLASFQAYYEELTAWNARFNLTTITEYEEVQIKHFLDSLSCLLALDLDVDESLSCIDVGAGAGFPGLPLKIVCPRWSLTLLESTGKKVTFLQHLIERLQAERARAIKGRAEELGRDPAHREGYDLVLARAVAPLPVLVEYTLPFCRLGGMVIAQKGPEAQAEAEAARPGVAILGGQLRDIKAVPLPGLTGRRLVVIDKVDPTPDKYPRRPGVPVRRPLS